MIGSTKPVLAGVLLAACAGGDAGNQRDALATRDSAGIEIVENDSPLWTEATRWRVAEAPSLQIGAGVDDDPAAQFGYIAGVHRLSNGQIAVLDSWTPGVNFFDAAGRFLGRVGRTGTGPGEFPRRTSLNSFTCGSDTVFVFFHLRVAAFTAPNTYVRTFSMEPPARILACMSNTLIAQARGSWRQTAPGTYTDSMQLVSYDFNGRMRAPIDSLPDEERDWSRGPEGSGYMPRVFGRRLSVVAADTTLATGFGDAFEITLRSASGAVTRVLRVAGLERTVSKADVDAFRSYVFNPWSGNEAERVRLEERLASASGRPLPAFAELRFDRAGNIWARQYDYLDAVAFFDYSSWSRGHARPKLAGPRHWIVLRPDGRYLGSVTTPPGFTVHQIGEDWILGVWRDELDIQFVRQYALIKQ